MQTDRPPSRGRRVAVVSGLVLLAIVLLPITAFLLDGVDENLIFPVHIVLMLGAGAAAWTRLPGIPSVEPSTGRAAVFGAAIGLGAALVAYALFFLLLSGLGEV